MIEQARRPTLAHHVPRSARLRTWVLIRETWYYEPQGNTIGSVRGLADGGRTTVIMLGGYFRPGSHEERVPARALSIVDGKATLQTETVEALKAPQR